MVSRVCSTPLFEDASLRFFADYRKIDPKHLLPLSTLREIVPLVETYIDACVKRDREQIAQKSKQLSDYFAKHEKDKIEGIPFLSFFPSHFPLPRNRIAPLPAPIPSAL